MALGFVVALAPPYGLRRFPVVIVADAEVVQLGGAGEPTADGGGTERRAKLGATRRAVRRDDVDRTNGASTWANFDLATSGPAAGETFRRSRKQRVLTLFDSLTGGAAIPDMFGELAGGG